jgi:hypothetical protein
MATPRAHILFGSALCLFCVFCNGSGGGSPSSDDATPNADGEPCNADIECKSDRCAGGSCQAPASGAVEIGGDCSSGDSCVRDATCEGGICVEDAGTCAVLLAPCLVNDDCCSQACAVPLGGSDLQGSCTAGKGMCLPLGASCHMDGDCCAGRCDFRVTTSLGLGKCSTTCKAHGDACNVGDCCNGYCDADSKQCYDCLDPTIADGHACLSDGDCCGETCVGAMQGTYGTCECKAPGGCGQ